MANEEVNESPWGDYERELNVVKFMRQNAYQANSDPLFFGWQRGDNTEQEWLDAVAQIKEEYPYPEVTE